VGVSAVRDDRVRRVRLLVHSIALGAALLGALPLGSPAPAQAGLTWSTPFALNTSTPGYGHGRLESLSCPSATQCTAVGIAFAQGYVGEGPAQAFAFTFDPLAPGGPTAGPVQLATFTDETIGGVFETILPATHVSCPSRRECVASAHGSLVTFDPRSPAGTTKLPVAAIERGAAVSCATASQCTAIGYGASYPPYSLNEYTFDPRSPGNPEPASVYSGIYYHQMVGLACPSRGQCTALDVGAAGVTFDPRSPVVATTFVQFAEEAAGYYDAFACPTRRRCTAVTRIWMNIGPWRTQESTFNPTLSERFPAELLVAGEVGDSGIACPVARQCTAGGTDGGLVTFNPRSPGTSKEEVEVPGGRYEGISCPSTHLCVAVSRADDLTVGTDAVSGQYPPH
jgi:hypothetical protein